MFTVYVLKSKSTGKIYIGQTINEQKRISQHNNPNAKLTQYTKVNKGPWEIVYKETYLTRDEAIKREKQLKSSRGRNYIKSIIQGP